MANGELIILDIGIDICTSCPYPDCVGTDTELCHLIKDEVRRVKGDLDREKQKRDRKVLEKIQKSVSNSDSGLTMPELREELGYEYGFLQSLMRRGKLKSRRQRTGKKVKVIIIGVNFDLQ